MQNPQAQQQTEVVVDDSATLPSYSNFCRVTATPEEVILDFGLNPQPFATGRQEVKANQRIVMNFYTAKRLLTALGMTIQRHEGTFGSIELDVRRRATGAPQTYTQPSRVGPQGIALAGGDLRPLYRGHFEGIGTDPHFLVSDADGATVADERDSLAKVASPEDAVPRIFAWLGSHSAGLEVVAVGHRVVHGGPVYSEPVVVDGPTLEALTAFEPVAPARQPRSHPRGGRGPSRADPGGVFRHSLPPDRAPGGPGVRAAP